MTTDILGITRVVSGYSKIPNENGQCRLLVEYNLRPVDLKFLQILFEVDPKDPDAVNRDLVYCYQINADQAKALQPFVIEGVIDLEKYDFMLECYQE